MGLYGYILTPLSSAVIITWELSLDAMGYGSKSDSFSRSTLDGTELFLFYNWSALLLRDNDLVRGVFYFDSSLSFYEDAGLLGFGVGI